MNYLLRKSLAFQSRGGLIASEGAIHCAGINVARLLIRFVGMVFLMQPLSAFSETPGKTLLDQAVMSELGTSDFSEVTRQLLLEYGQASGRNEDGYAELGIRSENANGMIRFGFGKSEVDTENKELFTETYLVALDGRVTEQIGIGLSYRDWGDSGALKINTYTAQGVWYGQKTFYSLSMMARYLELFTLFTDPDVDRVNGTGHGVEASVTRLFGQYIEFLADVTLYEYSLDMRQFSDFSGSILTNRTLDLGSAFLDANYLLELAYNFPDTRISGRWEHSISAIDSSDWNTYSIGADSYFSSGFQVFLTLGRSYSNTGLVSNFGGTGATIYWY